MAIVNSNELAQYAAVCATVSLALSAYLAWRDRSRIAIPFWGAIAELTNWGETDCKYLRIIVANVGRRPVSIIFATLWVVRPTGHLAEVRPKFILSATGELELASTRLFMRPIVIGEASSVTFLYEFQQDCAFQPIRTQVTDVTGKTYNSIAIGGEYHYMQARFRLIVNTAKNLARYLAKRRAA
jgi:hypothetical protein